MAPVLIPDVVLRTVGRTGCDGPLAVVLHAWDSGIEQLDSAMSLCPRPRLLCPKTCHQSFHFGIGGACNFHQYVDIDDTSWGFYSAVPTCPEPTCPEDECASCTGLTVAQYNPDVDGNPPTLPAFVADDCDTANGCVIHVALTNLYPTNQQMGSGLCCDKALPGYICAVQSLAWIFTEADLDPSTTTLLVHCNEHNCIDIDVLVEDIIAYQNQPAPVPPDCRCTATTLAPAALCAVLADLDTSLSAGTLALGPDCEFHPLPDSLTNCAGVDLVPGVAVIAKADITGAATVVSASFTPLALSGGGCPVKQVAPDCDDETILPVSASEKGNIVLTPGTAGSVTWARADFISDRSYAGPTIDISASDVLANGPTFIFTSIGGTGTSVAISDLGGTCTGKHLWIKNGTNSILTITHADPIDGSLNPITLDPVNAGAYPFGNDGGEAVHLIWNDVAGGWYVL